MPRKACARRNFGVSHLTVRFDERIAFLLMNILALDTCFGACSVAASSLTGATASEFELRQTGHAEALMPMVERVMAKARMRFSELERIAVTTGPGSFTGMRIGISAARALALVTGAPAVGVPTLEAMARAARRLSDENAPTSEALLVAIDARKEQVYAQLFRNGVPVGNAEVLTPQQAAALVPSGPVILAGSGAHLAANFVKNPELAQVLYPNLQATAVDVLALAVQMTPAATAIRPLYLRPPDAKPQDGKSISRLT